MDRPRPETTDRVRPAGAGIPQLAGVDAEAQCLL